MLRPCRVYLCLVAVGSGAAKDPIEATGIGLGALCSHSLAHDRTSASQHLEVRHCAATRGDMSCGSGK